jgi:hypothetical protein
MGTPVVTAVSAFGVLRGDDPGIPVGFRFTALSAITIDSLGRWIHGSSDTNTYTLTLYDWTAAAVIATITLNATGQPADAFAYSAITPITLVSGHDYSIETTAKANLWYDSGGTVLTYDTSLITVVQAIFSHTGGGTAGAHSYGPVSFTTSTSSTPVDETVSDTISLSDSATVELDGILTEIVGDSYTLSDSAAYELDGVNEVTASDSLAFGDSINVTIDFALQLSDSLSFSDSINFNDFQIVIITGDGLALSDSLVVSGDSPLVFSDRIILLDFASVDAPASSSGIGDSYTLSDSAQVVLEINLDLSDSIVIDDTPGLFLTEVLEENFSDEYTLSDSISLFLSTSDTSYLRAYLNDIQGVRTPEDITPDADESPNALNDYLRRYLNDVT